MLSLSFHATKHQIQKECFPDLKYYPGARHKPLKFLPEKATKIVNARTKH